MAKKRAKADGAKKAAPKKKNLVVIRGWPAWGEWLEGYAKYKGMPVTVLFDHLLRESSKKDGYTPPPPPRY